MANEKSEKNEKVRWGVLGAARINRRMIPGLKEASNAEVIGVASRALAKASETAQQFGLKMAFPSYEALLADKNIDAVYIPLPNALHPEWIIKAVEAGKHVLCEKPLALTVGEVRQVEEAAERTGKLVMEAFMYRFHPQHIRLRERIANGDIGEVRSVRGTYAFVLNTGGYNIRLDPKIGGGAVWDVGCYGINVARWMFGSEPRSVYAQATLENGVDTSTAVIMEFSGGKRATFDFGLNYGRRSFYEVIGTKGSLSVENAWQEPDLPAYVYYRNDKGLETEEIAPVSHFKLEAEAFGAAILEGKPAPLPLSDTLANTRVCQAVLQSLHTGKSVEVQ
jgi:D-xylose 1-dehydrogenase (NADP+, D-xylono-1,5-lactone-forming)